ncbi:MAG: hypothetical protein ABII79_14095 [bacterium]
MYKETHRCQYDGEFKRQSVRLSYEHGRPVSSGVYLYKLKADDFTTSKKMLLLK